MSCNEFDFVCETNSACERGASFSKLLTWTIETPQYSGNFIPVDITNYTAKMQVRLKPGSPLIIELSTQNGRITLGGALGTIALDISASVTATLPAGIYKYELDLIDSNSFVTRFIEGSFEVEETLIS